MQRSALLVLALVSVLALGACNNVSGPNTSATTELTGENLAKPGGNLEAPGRGRGAPARGMDPIAAIAIEAGFSELVGALSYVDEQLEAGLVDLFLNGKDQYTVFAPNNEAFFDLYALLSTVLETEIDEITDVPATVVLDVLFYHVTEGRRFSGSVVPPKNEREITPLLGEFFYVRTDGTIRDGLTGLRDDAAIVQPNISASNGIIHEIDQVIVPPSVVAALTEG